MGDAYRVSAHLNFGELRGVPLVPTVQPVPGDEVAITAPGVGPPAGSVNMGTYRSAYVLVVFAWTCFRPGWLWGRFVGGRCVVGCGGGMGGC